MDLAQSSALNHQLLTESVVPSVNVRAPGLLQALSTPNQNASILVIDPTIDDYQQLIAGTKPGTEVHVLNPAQNAIDQITQLLIHRSGISSLHIVSHGAANALQIGHTWIDRNTLDRYATEFKSWSTALTENADILLYGCDIAKGDKTFIQSMSDLTQADVAASIDYTGSTQLGGNWTLEASTGAIESVIPFTAATLAAYNHILPVDLISVAPPNLSSSAVGIDAIGKNATSGDGRFVVFTSSASTISPNDSNNASDVFLYDRQTEQVTLVSHNLSNTGTATGRSFNPVISDDGSSVAFISNANDLVNATASNTRNVNNIFVWNRLSGEITLVSQTADGKSGAGDSSAPSISDDGKYIAFQTFARLLPSDTNVKPREDVYVWSREGSTLTHVSRDRVDDAPNLAQGAFTPVISGDGNYVAFASVYSNLTSNDFAGYQDIFLWERSSDTLINLTIDGDGASSNPTISRDGSRVAFVSSSTQFGNDTNNAKDVFVWTRSGADLSGSIQMVSVNQFNTDSGNASGILSGVSGSQDAIISRDGNFVVFTSASSDLVSDDTNNSTDVFVRDLTLNQNQTRLISRNNAGTIGNGNSSTPDISADGKRIAFVSNATNLTANDTNNQPDIFVWDEKTNTQFLISRTPENAISNNGVGNSGSISASAAIPVISGDGSVVAFVSQSSNLVTNDRNGIADGFVIPVASGSATLISSRNTDPALASRTGSSDSINPRNAAISDDGRFVVFVSAASELTGADGVSVNNVFLRDRQTGETILVSRALTGTANGESSSPMISANGQYVVFMSAASNLIEGDKNNATDIFLFDRLSNQLKLVSQTSKGSANGASINPTISSDGQYVVFMSTASDLVSNDTNNKQDVFLWDRVSGAMTRISDGSDGTSEQAIISRDGSAIAFVSDATNLVTGDTNGKKDVFVWTRSTNSITLVSRANDISGAIGNDDAYQPSLSDNGRVVAFTSRATNLAGDLTQTSNENVFVRDLNANTTRLVSINRDNTYSAPTDFGTFGAFNPIISGNGQFVVFASNFSDLVATDTNNAVDFFLRDLTNNKTQLVSINSSNNNSGNGSGGGLGLGTGSIDAAISSTGRYVVFSSFSSDLVSGDTNNAMDVFVRDFLTNTTTLVSQNAAGTASGNNASFYPAISSKGSYIAFTSAASDLTDRDLNGKSDVFGLNLATTVSIASIVASTTEPNGAPAKFRIRRSSTNGDLVVKLAIDTSSTASASDYSIAAENGINLNQQGNELTFTLPSGVSEAVLTVSAIDDSITEVPETVVLKVVPTIDYDISDSFSSTVTIIDTDTTVTNTNDAGEGSLRQAILNANANAGKDTINFQLAGDGPQTISLLSVLPELKDAIVINGSNIVLDGVKAGASANGFVLAAGSDSSMIQGIEIRGFAGSGILINSSNNTIATNKIVANGSGIEIASTGLNNRISQNSIASNTGLGIDLGQDGITLNDVGDLDTGANNLQNTVEITTARPVGGGATIKGTFNGAPNSKFQVELFRNDATGSQGQTFLKDFEIGTDANGDATFEYQASGVTIGEFITATVTDANDNTSEFSTAKEVSLPKVSIRGVNLVQRENAGGDKTQYDFVVSLDQPSDQAISVRVKTENGTATSGSDYDAIDEIVTFDAGQTSKTVSVTVNDDLIQEPDETFIVSVAPIDSAVIAGATTSATATIQDDDAKPTVSIANVTPIGTKEGNVGKTAYTFEVRLSKPAASDVTVNYTTQDGTATSGEDYDAVTSSITFKAGETVQTIAVNAIGDTKFEQDETFSVNLTDVSSNVELATKSATATIVNDDTAPTIRISGVAAIDEGNPDAGSTQDYPFTVTLSEASSVPISVNYRTVDQEAVSGEDYVANTGTLTFAPGITSQQIVVKVNRDRTVERDEQFTLALVSSDFGIISPTDGSAIGTIRNDDTLEISIKSTNASQIEGDSGTSPYEFEVSFSNPVDQPVTVTFDAIDGTALAGEDYTLSTTSLTFAPGETKKTFTADIIGDRKREDTESFSVKLKTSTVGTIKNDTAIATIIDNDPAPTVTAGNVTAIEGNNTNTVFNFDLTLSEASAQSITVNYSTVDGTATVADQDYTQTSGSVTFNPGEIKKTVSVTVKGDTKREADETFFLKLDSATNATIVADRDRAVGTIQNDDLTPSLSITPTSTQEGGALTFVVTLDSASGETVSVDYETSDGSATLLDNDYTSTSGKLQFAPGVTRQTLVVQTIDDAKREPDETINVTLKNPSNATLTTATAIGTIQNNDAPPIVSIAGGNAKLENGGPIQFVVNLSSASGETVTVNYITKNGTAIENDYMPAVGTLVFLPGETRKTIDIQLIDDSRYESDETFSVELSQPMNASLGTTSAIGTILNDDPKPRITIATPPAQSEGGSSALTPVVFEVRLDRASDLPITVNYATADGTATTANKDYLATAATLEFKPGETQKTIAIPVLGDLEFEENETFQLNFSNPTNATLETQSVTATILNDDAAPPVLDPTNGRYDVLWRNARTGENLLWRTNNTVLESEFSILDVPDSRWQIVATGDFDGDGTTDLVWRNTRTGENGLWKMRNNQFVSGTFIWSVPDTSWEIKGVGDFNGDRKLDLVWRNARTGETAVWYLNDMTVMGSTYLPSVPDTSWNIAGVGDFDNDGISDLFWSNARTGETAVWKIDGNKATGRYSLTVNDLAWKPKQFGDFNRDGFLDILWSNPRTGENALWLMNKGEFGRSVYLPSTPTGNWTIERVADFNDDQILDILWRNNNTRDVAIWYMNGETLGYSAIVGQIPDNNWTIAGIGAFGGYHQPEIVLRNYATGENRIWRTDNSFRQQISLDSERDRAASIVATGDFDNDGQADLVWRNTRTGETSIWFTANGRIREKISVAPFSTDSSWSIEGVGDFDRDGQLDLLWRNLSDGAVNVWRLDRGRFVGAVQIGPKVDSSWKIKGIADLNGDRSLDIVWLNSVTGEIGTWLLDRTVLASPTLITNVGNFGWQIKGVADFNNDGKADFLWQNARTGETVVWIMNGIRIERTIVLPTVDTSWSIAGIGDFNSDNRLDLLWRNSISGSNAVWYLDRGKFASGVYLDPLPDLDWQVQGINDF